MTNTTIQNLSKLVRLAQETYGDALPEGLIEVDTEARKLLTTIAAGKRYSVKKLDDVLEWYCEASKDEDKFFDAIMIRYAA